MGSKRTGTRQDLTPERTVREDWFASLPEEMDQLFGATRNELESSNEILSVTLDEALALCEQGQLTLAKEKAVEFVALFDRLAIRLRLVIRTMEEHATYYWTSPKITALDAANFRGTTARRISFMDTLRARDRRNVGFFSGRARFLHKLHALKEIIEKLQLDCQKAVEGFPYTASKHRAFDPPSRDMSDSRRKPSFFRLVREVFQFSSPPIIYGFFREISESPRMKFSIAWGTFGVLVVPLAAAVANGITERTALFVLLGAIFPVQYAIFVANNLVAILPKQHAIFIANNERKPDLVDTWVGLDELGYDLNTCMAETTVMLKSFFCALTPERDDSKSFIRDLRMRSEFQPRIGLLGVAERQGYPRERRAKMQYLTAEYIAAIK